ncbi:hypothetical protein BABINDRAFT_12707 [Babjeviella inositovora NRRL Y-12698]|uniref:Uncharacterized protein n=1 Tax=Babjeviella inositovora NRRL Y-12698 TaxID=984486 RepID=A0A1E3QSB8_9ASCO|nr:uncharacterized protein BABINDRAFT_12707 [Babjeviella inositovora NRRL Y-12698]ODQ80560.1 hypothetical protein BABINDRAFT_12707 [Babjeviella inositovora NRRL Y-12698]
MPADKSTAPPTSQPLSTPASARILDDGEMMVIASTPMKSPHNKVLPPLEGNLSIPKKRRGLGTPGSKGSYLNTSPLLSPDTSSGNDQNVTPRGSTPLKQNRRSVSTPIFNRPSAGKPTRVVSIHTTPIPELTPPGSNSLLLDTDLPDSLTSSTPSRSFSSPLLYKKIFTSKDGLSPSPSATPLLGFEDQSPSRRALKRKNVNDIAEADTSGNSTGNDSSVHAKLVAKKELKDLRRSEAFLDVEIKKYEDQIGLITRANRYLASHKTSEEPSSPIRSVDALIEKWRSVGQQAASYLLNSALVKVSNMGGYQEYRKRQADRTTRQLVSQFEDEMAGKYEGFIELEEYKEMSALDKKELDERYNEYKRKSEVKTEGHGKKQKTEEEGNAITMKQLFRELNVEYALFFDD